jgi:hypothetical protein
MKKGEETKQESQKRRKERERKAEGEFIIV